MVANLSICLFSQIKNFGKMEKYEINKIFSFTNSVKYIYQTN